MIQRVNREAKIRKSVESVTGASIGNTVVIDKAGTKKMNLTDGFNQEKTVMVSFDVRSQWQYPATSECEKNAVQDLKDRMVKLNRAYNNAVKCQNEQLNIQSGCLLNCTKFYSALSYECKSTYDLCTNTCSEKGELGCGTECSTNYTICDEAIFVERTECNERCFDIHKPLNCSWKEKEKADEALKTLFDIKCYE